MQTGVQCTIVESEEESNPHYRLLLLVLLSSSSSSSCYCSPCSLALCLFFLSFYLYICLVLCIFSKRVSVGIREQLRWYFRGWKLVSVKIRFQTTRTLYQFPELITQTNQNDVSGLDLSIKLPPRSFPPLSDGAIGMQCNAPRGKVNMWSLCWGADECRKWNSLGAARGLRGRPPSCCRARRVVFQCCSVRQM